MQTLWSRVAQTRSCRCVSCIHNSAKALSRRTATSATRPRLTPGDLFTACFSSTLATAAVLDAKAKQRRRDQWDQAIREAKGEEPAIQESPIEDVKTEQEFDGTDDLRLRRVKGGGERFPIEKDLPRPSPEIQESALQEPVNEDVKSEQDFDESDGLPLRRVIVRRERLPITRDLLWPSKCHGRKWKTPPPSHKASMEVQLELLNRYISNFVSKTESILEPGQPFVLKRTVTSVMTGETSIYLSKLPDRKPKTPMHLQLTQDSISRLVARLLVTVKSMGMIQPLNETTQKLNMDLRAQVAEKIALLSSEDTQLPSYGFVDTEDAESQVIALNRSLSSILQATETMPDIMVARVCYNLLVSPVPPDVTTYNVLMLNFTKLGLGDLAQVVVDGFLDDCILKPNEMTIAAMLNHYMAQNDYPGFYRLIQRMRGVDGDLRIKKRHIYFLYHNRVRSWAKRAKVICRNGYLIEKAPRDQIIFQKLVVGTCMFGHMTRAVMFTRAMVREGYCLTLGLLNTLVRAFISKRDLKHARALLKIVLDTWTSDEGKNGMTTRLDISSHARYFIHMLMSFCGINFSENWTIEEIAPPLLKAFDPVALRRFSRALQLQSAAEDVNRMSLTILDVLGRLVPHLPSLETYENHGTTSDMATYKAKKPRKAGDPPPTLYVSLKKAQIYLSRRLDSEHDRQKQRRLREKEAAMLYLEGGKAERRLEMAKIRELQNSFAGSDLVCEDDHSLADSQETDARQIIMEEETIEQPDTNALKGMPSGSARSSLATDSRLESENPMSILNPLAAESSTQLALTTTSEQHIRATAAAA